MTRKLQVIVDDTPTSRTCGTCNLCCTTHGIEELAKPREVKCRHLNVLGRCGIYPGRPESCRVYKCQWLQGHLPMNMKPITSRAVIDVNAQGDMLVAHVLPWDRGCLEHGVLHDFIKRVSPLVAVIVVIGNDRILYGAVRTEIALTEHNVTEDGSVVLSKDIPYTRKDI